MLKSEFFIQAMKAGNYKYLDWIFSVFCLTKESAKSDFAYSYKVLSDPTGYSFVDKDGKLVKIEAEPNKPIFTLKETLTITPDDIPNLTEEIKTTYGNLLTNWILCVEPFGKKIPYQNKKISISTLENIINSNFNDDPKNPDDKKEDAFYVSEYLKFADSAFYLTGLTQVCVWANTEKIMLPPPGLKEYKAKLLKEYAGRLNEAAVIAEITAKLIAFDAEYLKGDEGNNFLLSKKSRNIVRAKKFLMHGGEVGLDGNTVNVTLVENSLNEGWDLNAFPAMNNSLRIGSFSRGAETMLGGVEVKWALRASSNINVTIDDCHSPIGRPITVTTSNHKTLIGFSIVTKDGSTPIDSEAESVKYIGQKIMRRSPQYCQCPKTDYCRVCVGKKLSATPFSLSSAIAAYGSAFLSASLAASHAKQLELAHMDYKTAIF